MLRKLAKAVASHYVRNKAISLDELEIHSYGFELLLSSIINLFFVMTTAIMFRIPLEALVFVFSFVLLRAFGGGYHAKTHRGCIWTFFILFALFSILIHFLPMDVIPIYILATALTSLGFIWVTAPVEAKNKQLSVAKQLRLKKCCRIVALIYFGIAVWNFFVPFIHGYIAMFAFSGEFAASSSIVFAALTNKVDKLILRKATSRE